MDCPTLRRASCSFAPFSIKSISFRDNVTDPSSSIYFLAVNLYAYKISGIVSKSENHILSLVRFTNLGFSWIILFRKHSALSLPSEPVPLTYLPSPPYPIIAKVYTLSIVYTFEFPYFYNSRHRSAKRPCCLQRRYPALLAYSVFMQKNSLPG